MLQRFYNAGSTNKPMMLPSLPIKSGGFHVIQGPIRIAEKGEGRSIMKLHVKVTYSIPPH